MRAPLLVLSSLFSLSLLALGSSPALAGERAAIILVDGQTLEGDVEVLGGGDVDIVIEVGGAKQRLRLAGSAIERIEPLAGRAEETLPEAVVRMNDGRELRGEARVRSSEVVIKGPYGQVVVPRSDVRSIAPVLPELPRTVADADTGLVLPLPVGWFADEPGAVGERLRLVRDDGAATLSVLLRALPPSEGAAADQAARVRKALRHDLGSGATLEALDERRWRVRDTATDHAVPGTWPLHLVGVVELVEDHVVFFRALVDASADLDAALPGQLEDLVERQSSLRAGTSRDGGFFRDPALGVFLEAPAGFRVRESKVPGERARVVSPSDPTAQLVVHVVDDPAPRDALLDLLEGAPETTDEVPLRSGGGAVFRARRPGERGVALRTDAGTVAIVARAAKPEPLAQLTLGVLLIHPAAAQETLDAAERLLPLIDRAREALDADDPKATLAALEPVLAEHPDEPAARALRVAALRAQKAAPDVLIEELDAAWVAAGSPWIAQELARTLTAYSSALAEAGEHAKAVDAIERAAEAWGDDVVAAAAIDLLTAAAKRAHAAGEPLVCWARFARLRELVGARTEVDDAEAALRLVTAKAALEAGDTNAARREARRAYTLGADAGAVERIYAGADGIDRDVDAAKETERARRDARAAASGGLAFGVPPSRNNRGSRVRDTAFERRSEGTSRFVRPAQRDRGSRVRGRVEGQGKRVKSQPTRKGRRVRSNGSFVFD